MYTSLKTDGDCNLTRIVHPFHLIYRALKTLHFFYSLLIMMAIISCWFLCLHLCLPWCPWANVAMWYPCLRTDTGNNPYTCWNSLKVSLSTNHPQTAKHSTRHLKQQGSTVGDQPFVFMIIASGGFEHSSYPLTESTSGTRAHCLTN